VRVRSRGHELGQRGRVWGEEWLRLMWRLVLDGRVAEGGGKVAVEVVDVGWEDALVDTGV